MEHFLVRQPNGLLCKVSILTLEIIRDDITDEEYVEECVKREREWTRYILENHLEPLTIKPTAREDFETRIEINAEAARREAKSVLESRTDYNRFGEYIMNEVMTRERLEEWLQEASKARKRLCGTIKEVVNIFDSICKEIVKVSQEISKDDVRRQNCLEGKFCAHCKHYQEESATYVCKNECSELFNKNLAPFQTCRYFEREGENATTT